MGVITHWGVSGVNSEVRKDASDDVWPGRMAGTQNHITDLSIIVITSNGSITAPVHAWQVVVVVRSHLSMQHTRASSHKQ